MTKGKEQLLRRYPVGIEISEDSDSVDMHKKAVSHELSLERRMFIQNATCVKQIIEKYPALSRRAIVSIIC